jgi:hypothetical protein
MDILGVDTTSSTRNWHALLDYSNIVIGESVRLRYRHVAGEVDMTCRILQLTETG